MKRVLFVAGLAVCLSLVAAFPGNAVILVVSPHPDDDVLMASGVTYEAAERGEPVIVAYMTNGDFEGSGKGCLRQQEAVRAQVDYLKNTEDRLIFLGYPDGHLREFFTDCPRASDRCSSPSSGRSATYGSRGLGRADYHTYRFGSPAPYNLPNALMDLGQIITDFRPDDIIVTSEFDVHPDHSTTYAMLSLALEDVRERLPRYAPIVHKTVVHWDYPKWPLPANPSERMSEPAGLGGAASLDWNRRESIESPGAMQSLDYPRNPKYMAISCHGSQGGATGFLAWFLHKDEVFWIDTPTGGAASLQSRLTRLGHKPVS